ncbi:hypothetical protein [Candidatus Clostridium stratigraminis]|uniref:Uncharacterized protein n=1 Tax=Candidatus Clostridium stratigraminis TaxID=3381661 RepID=A0ABW8T7Z3_9CLOT
MIQNNNELEIFKKLKKDLKPKLYWPIWNTIICSGPLLNLIFRYFLTRDMKNPTVAIILSVIAMIWTIIEWYWYVKERNDFNKNWGKVTIELQSLNIQDEPSKDIIGTIFDILMKTAIASLVLFFIFAAILIFAKYTFFKYLMIFSLLVFLLTAGGLIIVGTIMVFTFIRIIIKGGRLKEVLKRFILISTLSFIILIIINFIKYKNPEWIEAFLKSLLISLPTFLSIETFMLYKEIKKEYSLNTSPDEGDSKYT